jgi:hypothetical protein
VKYGKIIVATVGVGAALILGLVFAPALRTATQGSRASRPAPQDFAAAPSAAAPSAIRPAQSPDPNPAASGSPTLPKYTHPIRDRAQADKLREALSAAYATAAGSQEQALAKMPAPAGEGNQADKPLGKYVASIMKEQFMPLITSCYDQLLERTPSAAGDVVLQFSVMGNSTVGGVVVDVAFGKGTTLTDPEFSTCTQESLYAVIFDAPPNDQAAVTVTQSFSLAP